MKKVVSFSLYGDLNCYLLGALENLEIKEKFYPDWIYRFYIDKNIDESIKKKLLDSGSEVIEKKSVIGQMGTFWRFEVLDDDNVDIFICRDVDSRPTKREVEVVKKWEESKFYFHIIRDHPNHHMPIMAGLWGSKKIFKPNFKNLYNNWIKTKESIDHNRGINHGFDQFFLKDCIWPLIKNNHLAHVRNYPQLKLTGQEIIIAEPNDGKFMGQSYLKDLNKKYGE